MPDTVHDRSSREIFSSPHGLSSGLPDTPDVLDHAAVAPGSGSFGAGSPRAPSGFMGASPQPGAAVAAFQRPATAGVGQDKGASDAAPQGSVQPSPVTKDVRRSGLLRRGRQKAVRLTLWVQPGVKLSLQTIAAANGLSLSATGAGGLEEWVRQDIQRQQEALLQPLLRKIIREELRTFSNRLVFFLMRIAFAAEQGRILVTNVLERVLKREGVSMQRVHTLVDQSDKLARRNIIQKTPKLRSLIEEWEASFVERDEKKGQGSE